jgi:hypothetical protein
MNKLNWTIIITFIIIGSSVIISVWLDRDIEIKKIKFQLDNQQKITDCIKKVQAHYGEIAKKGVGILNIEEVLFLKKENSAEEDRCIRRYK